MSIKEEKLQDQQLETATPSLIGSEEEEPPLHWSHQPRSTSADRSDKTDPMTTGQIGDSCGRRYLMIGGCTLGVIGLAVTATAKSMNVAILGTVIYIVSEVTTRRWRPRAQQAMNVCGSIGLISGVMIQAEFITRNSSPTGYQGWPPNPKGLTVLQRVLECDLVGSALIALSLTPILLGIIWGGGATAPWKSAQVLAPLLIGIGFLFVLAYHQVFIKKDGLFNHELFANRNVVISMIGLFVEGFTQFYESRNIFLALRYSSFLYANILGGLSVQWYSYRYKAVKIPLVGGFGCFLIAMIGIQASSKLVIFWSCLAGFGFSAPIALLVVTAQLGAKAEHIGLVTGLIVSSRTMGGAVGVAIATAVFSDKLAIAIPEYIAEAAVAAGLPVSSLTTFVTGIATNNVTLAETAPGVTTAIIAAGGGAVVQAYSFALKYNWIVASPFVLLSMVLCMFLAKVDKEMNYEVDRPSEMTQQVDHSLEHGNTRKE
ncbi:hypothetical protein RQP46_009260 [Phenoliferia psychrophenolica]